jgi:hypothetical protein
MPSLFDELNAKIARNPGLTKRNVARFDMTLLLFNHRDDVNALWKAADTINAARDEAALRELAASVERLRPIFGERPEAR